MDSDLPEDALERAQFDSEVSRLFGGNELARVAAALTIWAQMAPLHGSYGKQCAIMANVVGAAARKPAQKTEGD
jgi:hypothetical protein